MPMGDSGLTLKGIPSQCTVGYLSQLEALRYCEVGSFLKTPRDPVWVIGSQSHFTVLFATDRTPISLTRSESLLALAQRAFKASDVNENGYIPKEEFHRSLEQLRHELPSSVDDHSIPTLAAHLETAGAGIILWDDYWRTLSRLMTGTTLQSILDGTATRPADQAAQSDAGGRATVHTPARERSDSEVAREMQAALNSGQEWQPPEPVVNNQAGDQAGAHDSDLEYARRLQAELNGETLPDPVESWVQPAQPAQPTPATTQPSRQPGEQPGGRPRSDSEIARELQAQMDRGEDTDLVDLSTLAQAASEAGSVPESTQPRPQASGEGKSQAAGEDEPPPRLDLHRHDSVADETGTMVTLYHFNGLTRANTAPRLVPFELTMRSANDMIGVAVPLSGSGQNSGLYSDHPIEDVLRTRWPGARVNWKGQAPPSID